MFGIVNGFDNGGNDWLNISLLILACFRVYLEVIQFDFKALPLTIGLFQGDEERAKKFHRHGLYLSLGYIIFSAPFTLLT